MAPFARHRIFGQIEKKRKNGRNFIILSGDGINSRDKFFHDPEHGILPLKDAIATFYAAKEHEFNWFLHIRNSTSGIDCYRNTSGGFEKTSLNEMRTPAPRKTPFGDRKAPPVETLANLNAEAETASRSVDTGGDLKRMDDAIRQRRDNILIFVENLDLVAKLHETPADIAFLNNLREWGASSNVLLLVTISDMDLLKPYAFNIEDIFVGNPPPAEIFHALWRHILRNGKTVWIEPVVLDELAHALSAGKNSLASCMRILKRRLKNATGTLSLADFGDSIARPIEEKVLWKDVLLKEDVKRIIRDTVETFLKGANEGTFEGQKGLLLAGPPGTGKTFIAKALANKMQCYFMAPTLAELKGEYVGHTSGKVARIFAVAEANEPAILFIDEADTVFPSRNAGAGSDSFGLDMVNQFLQEMDGAKTGTRKIFVIAATNRPNAVDEAVLSRLGKPLEIPLPDMDLRRELFEAYIAKLWPSQPFKLKGTLLEPMILGKSAGMSGRDIANFVKGIKADSPLPLADDVATGQRFERQFERERENILRKLGEVAAGVVRPGENVHRLNEIRGLDSVRALLEKHAKFVTNEDVRRDYGKYGVEPARGIILHGPPGNGKTRLVECLAGEKGFHLIKVLSQDFASNTVQGQLEKLDSIFRLAFRFSRLLRGNEGIVLFFDEIDALASREVLNPVVRGTLLTYLSDATMLRDRDCAILFIGATNNMDKLDEAVVRRGRIDIPLYIPNPSRDTGIAILKQFAEDDSKHLAPSDPRLWEEAWDRLYNQNVSQFLAGLQDKTPTELAVKGEKKLQPCLPSGAALKELYRSLKETAFHLGSFSGDGTRLKINDAVLNNCICK